MLRCRFMDGPAGIKSDEQLREILVAAGLPARDDGREIVTYCQSGIRAAYSAFVLTMLGFKRVRVYEGSMMEWSANPAAPMVSRK